MDNRETHESTLLSYNNMHTSGITNESMVVKALQLQTYDAVHEQAQRIIQTIDSSNSQNKSENKNILKDYEIIDQSTTEMLNIWSDYYSKLDTINKNSKRQHEEDNQKFKQIYMDMVTEAFADELDDLRRGRNAKDHLSKKGKKRSKADHDDEEALKLQNIVVPKVNEIEKPLTSNEIKVLASCLEKGMDTWTEEEKRLLVQERGGQKNAQRTTPSLSIHEQRQSLLFGG